MKMAFIACFYGAIGFEEKTFEKVIEDANAWWDNPSLPHYSPAITVADAVTQMNEWATERDLVALAGIFDEEIIYGI
jgi:hypothetical protein